MRGFRVWFVFVCLWLGFSLSWGCSPKGTTQDGAKSETTPDGSVNRDASNTESPADTGGTDTTGEAPGSELPPEPTADSGTPDTGTPETGTPDSGTPDNATPENDNKKPEEPFVTEDPKPEASEPPQDTAQPEPIAEKTMPDVRVSEEPRSEGLVTQETTGEPEPMVPCGDKGLKCKKDSEMCVLYSSFVPKYECKEVPSNCRTSRDCACLSATFCTRPFNTCSKQQDKDQLVCACITC